MNRLATAAFLLAFMLASRTAAQHYQSDFPPGEFTGRWKNLFGRIGPDAVAVVQGMPLTDGYMFPRQYNSFYYLSGIETPGAYLVLDGLYPQGHALSAETKRSTRASRRQGARGRRHRSRETAHGRGRCQGGRRHDRSRLADRSHHISRADADRHLRRVRPGRGNQPEPGRAGRCREVARARSLGWHIVSTATLRRAAADSPTARGDSRPHAHSRRHARGQERRAR